MKKFTAEKETGLSRFLLDKYAGALKYGALMKIYRKKDVRVNGKRTDSDIRLSPGDVVECYYDADGATCSVVYADDNVVVCDKPSGIESSAFFEIVKADYPSAIFTHRLDRNTSGLMIFALNEKAYAELFHAFKHRSFDKYYTACVYGWFDEKNGVLKDYLTKDEKAGRVFVSSEKKRGSLMIETGYEELSRGEKSSVLSVKLYTGRTHQIRAHLAYYGHFVIGDGKYGDDRINRQFGVKRQLLRATKLVLRFNEGDYLYYLNGKSFEVDARDVFKWLK